MKNQTIVTPKGVARFPHLNEPDCRFNADGVYNVTLRLADAEAKPMIAQLTQMFDEHYANTLKEQNKKTLKKGPMPWGVAQDWDSENETKVEVPGFTDFKFTLKAMVKTKTGKTWEQKPALFDAKLKPMSPDSDPIGGGSTIKVNSEIYPWFSPSLGVGISLRIRGVQVIELKTYTPSDGKSMGFAAEDGYEAPASSASAFQNSSDTEDTGGDF